MRERIVTLSGDTRDHPLMLAGAGARPAAKPLITEDTLVDRARRADCTIDPGRLDDNRS